VIAGVLVLALLVGRELARAQDPEGPAIAIANRLLVPATAGLVALMALRLVDLAVGGA
jgi:hypothetical protein